MVFNNTPVVIVVTFLTMIIFPVRNSDPSDS